MNVSLHGSVGPIEGSIFPRQRVTDWFQVGPYGRTLNRKGADDLICRNLSCQLTDVCRYGRRCCQEPDLPL